MHYRLAQLPDPVMQALLDAVTHAIGHVTLEPGPQAAGDANRALAHRRAPNPDPSLLLSAFVLGTFVALVPYTEEVTRI